MSDTKDIQERRRLPFARRTIDLEPPRPVSPKACEATVEAIWQKDTNHHQTFTVQAAPLPSANGEQTKAHESLHAANDISPAPPKDEEPPAKFKALFNFTTKHDNKILIPGLVLSLAAGVLKPMMSVFLGLIFDIIASYMSGEIDGPRLIRDVSRWCAILTGIGCANWFVNGFMFVFWVSFGEAQARSVRGRMFKGLLRREMEWFDGVRDGIGSLLVRVQTQIHDLQLATSQPLGSAVDDIMTSLASIGVALYFSWKLTLVLCAIIPLGVVVIGLISRSLQPAVEAQKTLLGSSTKHANTAINAVDTVKIFNAQESEVKKYEKSLKDAAEPYYKQAAANAKQIGFSKFLMIMMFVTGFWYGLTLYNKGQVSAGNVLTCLYAFLQAAQSANAVFPKMLVLTKGMSAGQAIQEYLGEVDKRDDTQSRLMLGLSWPHKRCEGDVEMKDITFTYPSNPDQQVLKNATFSFPAGETTFLFGRSGSGKSTISNLLLKFYEPSTGEITIDGQRIERLDTKWVRENITLVQQESVLFNGTIEENLQFGSKDGMHPSEDDIKKACDLAMLTPVINDMPLGIKTMINSGGDTMSGGQKQRVAIARARLRDTPILILDEVTSALDLATKALVWEAIRYWRKGKTTIVITHDEQQIRDEDFVYLLRDGEVVEEGFRKMLVKDEHGVFAALENEIVDEGQSHLSPIREGDSDPEDRFAPTPTRSSVYKTAAPSIAESVDSYDSETRPETRPNTAVLANFRRFFSGPVPDQSDSFNTYSKRGSIIAGPSLLWANHMHMENAMRTPPPMRARAVDGPATPPMPPKYPFRPGVFERVDCGSRPDTANSRPGMRRMHSAQGRRSLRPLSHYEEEPEIEDFIHVVERGHPSEFPKMMIRRSELPENNRDSLQHTTDRIWKWFFTRQSKQDEEKRHSSPIELNRLSRPGLRRARRRKPRTTKMKSGEPATLAEIFRTVWPALPLRGRILLPSAFLCALLSAAILPAFSFILSKLLATFYVAKEDQNKEALKWALIAIGLAVADGFTSYLVHSCFEICGRLWVDELRTQALRNVLSQPREWLDDPANSPAQLSQILDRSAEEMRNLLGRFVNFAFIAITMIIISIVWAFIVCWKLTLVGVATVPALYGLMRLFDAVSNAWEKKTDTQFAVIGATLTETFNNIRIVRALTLESRFERKHTNALEEGYRIGLRRGLYSGILYGLSDATSMFSGSLFFYYGAILIGTGAYDFGGVMAAMTLLLFGMGSATAALAFMPQIAACRVTATQVLDLVNLPRQDNEITLFTADKSTPGFKTIESPLPIVMKDLNFAYPLCSDVPVLRNLTLRFEANQFTALVGSSGSGKSTILAILLALYSPSQARPTSQKDSRLSVDQAVSLAFGGASSATLNLPALRSHMALVPQFPIIFPTTVAENICYGLATDSPLCALGNVEAAARAAGIHEFISSLALGYETFIGETGQGLSGGQMMRVAIARALVRRPKVLVLDEPTAGLDGESADLIVAALKEVVEDGRETGDGVAVVVVTHDLRIMKRADRVVVLEKGSVAEEGRFDKLRFRGGELTRLVGGGEVGYCETD